MLTVNKAAPSRLIPFDSSWKQERLEPSAKTTDGQKSLFLFVISLIPAADVKQEGPERRNDPGLPST